MAGERDGEAATLVLEAFEPLPQRVRREVEEEAGRLVRFVEPDAERFAVRFG